VKVLGLDIATCTGFAVITNKKIIEIGKIKIPSKLEYRDRFQLFRSELVKLIDKHKPDAVALEGVYSGKNRKTTAFLNNLRGIAIEAVPKEVFFFSGQVKKVRKAVLDDGNLTKEEIFKWAVKKYKLKNLDFKKDNDITDAILLANWGILKLTEPS
jgi:crossover junction endodeoxyribonuclease RuvC